MPSKTTAKKAKKTVRKRTSRAIKYVYSFGKKNDGNAKMKELLGGKGANLAEMAAIGLPVPGGFTITTEVCTAYYDNGRKYPTELKSQVEKAIKTVERECGKKFAGILGRTSGRREQAKYQNIKNNYEKLTMHDVITSKLVVI